MKSSRIILLVFLVIAIGAIIGTVYNADTYSGFSEARENPGREFHIIGSLDPSAEVKEKVVDNTLTLSFSMIDGFDVREDVVYFGPKPVDFELSDEVVLTGRYEGDQFVASGMLLKCPSKYRPEEIQIGDAD